MPKKAEDNNDIELESFINPEQPIKTGFTIDPKEKMLGFAKLRVPAISPDIRRSIAESAKNIRSYLDKLV